MVKITYEPIAEVVVHEIVPIDMEDLLRSRITPAGTVPLYWCDGVLFTFSSMPWTKDIIKEYLQGKVHWAELHFTPMEKYKPILLLNDETYKQEFKIRVLDTSRSLLHRDLIKWLKGKALK